MPFLQHAVRFTSRRLFSALDLSSSTGSNYSVVEDVFLRLSKINRGETLLTHPYLLLLFIHKQFHRAHCVLSVTGCSSNISMNWISNRSLTRCPVQKTVSIPYHTLSFSWHLFAVELLASSKLLLPAASSGGWALQLARGR